MFGAPRQSRTGIPFRYQILSLMRIPFSPLELVWYQELESNQFRRALQARALPTELSWHFLVENIGIEPIESCLQSICAPQRIPHVWLRRPDSNRRHSGYGPDTLPTELLRICLAPSGGFEPPTFALTVQRSAD